VVGRGAEGIDGVCQQPSGQCYCFVPSQSEGCGGARLSELSRWSSDRIPVIGCPRTGVADIDGDPLAGTIHPFTFAG